MYNDVSKLKTAYSDTGRLLDIQEEYKIREIKTSLIRKAIELHKEIAFCSNQPSFQLYKDYVLFWFNVDNDTKLIKEKISTF